VAEDDVLRQTRQYYIEKLKEKASEIRPLVARITTLDQDLGDGTDFMGIIIGEGMGDTTGNSPAVSSLTGSGPRPKLRPDEFTGKTYFQSAKSYLERVKHAVEIDEILDALKRGGSPVGGKTPKKTLYISLVRSKEFAPIPGQKNYVGLRSWYPNLKSEKKASEKKHKK